MTADQRELWIRWWARKAASEMSDATNERALANLSPYQRALLNHHDRKQNP